MSDLWKFLANKISGDKLAVGNRVAVETTPAKEWNRTAPSHSFVDRKFNEVNEKLDKHNKSSTTKWAWRAVIALLCISLITFIIWFESNPESFSYSNGVGKTPSEHRLNGLYYWCTMTSTIGFGDICPITPSAKGVTSLYQIFVTLLSLGVIWNITDDHISKLKLQQ